MHQSFKHKLSFKSPIPKKAQNLNMQKDAHDHDHEKNINQCNTIDQKVNCCFLSHINHLERKKSSKRVADN